MGVRLPEDAIGACRSFPIAALANPKALAEFKDAVEWAIEPVTVATKG
jgi:hypothetical protein